MGEYVLDLSVSVTTKLGSVRLVDLSHEVRVQENLS